VPLSLHFPPRFFLPCSGCLASGSEGEGKRQKVVGREGVGPGNNLLPTGRAKAFLFGRMFLPLRVGRGRTTLRREKGEGERDDAGNHERKRIGQAVQRSKEERGKLKKKEREQ